MRVRRLSLLFAFVVLVLLLATVSRFIDARAPTTIQNGISYMTWRSIWSSPLGYDRSLADLATTGADWVSVIVTNYQDTITSTTIITTINTPTDADLVHAITQAHSLGLKVMLKPHVDLANDPIHWRGDIGQGFTETQWATWFASYQSFIYHYAQLAQAYDVEQFCVGTELATRRVGPATGGQ